MPNIIDSETIACKPKKPTAKALYDLRKQGKGLTEIGQAFDLAGATVSDHIAKYFNNLDDLDAIITFEDSKDIEATKVQKRLLMSMDEATILNMYPSYRIDSICKLQKMIDGIRNPLASVQTLNFVQVIRQANRKAFTRKARQAKPKTVIDVPI